MRVVCLGSWAVPFLLHTLLFPSLWYKLILVSSVHRMLFQNCEGFFRCRLANSNLAFLFLRLTNGLHLVVNPLYSLWWSLLWLLTLTHIHLPPGECSWSGQLLWRVFSSPGKEFFGHPPQLFSWSSGSFGVAELTGAFLLFKNVPNSCFGHA